MFVLIKRYMEKEHIGKHDYKYPLKANYVIFWKIDGSLFK